MKYPVSFCLFAGLAACQQPDPQPGQVSVPQRPVGVPSDWCLSTGPDGTVLILTETQIIPAERVTPAEVAATPACTAQLPGEPL
jgi:hypothetical protein